MKYTIQEKKQTILNLAKEIRRLRTEIKNETNQLYQLCAHNYEKKIDNEGCYSSSYYKCIYCGKNK